MTTITFPFGKERVEKTFDDNRLKAVLTSDLHNYKAPKGEVELVQEAIENPIGTPRLRDMAKDKENIVIIASDHTRPVPSKVIMPLMLKEIREGNPDADITILIATGCHRGTTRQELIDKFGEEIVENEKIVIHDCLADEDMASLGKLPSGGNLIINKLAKEADLLVSEGFIEPHFFAGFSGGRKSILPGIASRVTVLANHCSKFIDSDKARTGIIDGNPIHTDMLYAARAARLDFIVNVVIDADKKVIHAVAGDVDLAHRQGVDFLNQYCHVDAVPADIVISTNGGYPLDQNIYQSVKGMTAAEATVKPGGVIIMMADASDGHGGEAFYQTFKEEKNLDRMMKTFLSRSAEETIPDQWESQILCRILQKAKVIYVTNADDQLIEDMQMIPAHSLDDALKMAEDILEDKDASITAIPDGIAVVVTE